MRMCGRCGEAKDDDLFNWRYRDRALRDTYCRACRAEYKREHDEANRQRYIDQNVARRRRVREERTLMLLEHFAAHPCSDCGETDPVVLDFDHVRGVKDFGIGQHLADRSLDAIRKEMAKCDVVCANCHRRRTALRGGSVRAAVAQWQSLSLPN